MGPDQLQDAKGLTDVITRKHPLGPAASEALVGASPAVFQQLYDATNHIHRDTHAENPSYIVGRKGSGKTAFLIGAALAENADVVPIQSEDIYPRSTASASTTSARTARSSPTARPRLGGAALPRRDVGDRVQRAAARRRRTATGLHVHERVRRPEELEPDALLARVSALMTESRRPRRRLVPRGVLGDRSRPWHFVEAARQARVVDDAGADAIYVVVDNLEDLHRRLDDFEDVITALFRVTSRSLTRQTDGMPFRTRFAFPAELLPRCAGWPPTPRRTSSTTSSCAGPRRSSSSSPATGCARSSTCTTRRRREPLGLPSQHDPNDRDAAETLRAVLRQR